MDDVFVEIEGLVKRFGPFTAVDGLSFQVGRGDVLGFLGPNGAGKSTTMKMITGFLTPSEGRVSICGNDIREDPIPAQSLIGYLPEGAPAYGDMTPRQYLNFIAEVRGYRGSRVERAVHRASSRAQLGGVMDQLIETLSKGFKRRVGLAQAILHDPPVLVMDEPTDGLDPNQKFAVRRLITGMARNKAIIISTHILEEVESICSRALIIDRGRIVADGTPEQLAARSRYHNAVTLEVSARDAAEVRKTLEALPGTGDILTRHTKAGTERLTLFPKEPDHLLIEDVSEVVARQKWDVGALYAEAGRLDEVFRTLTTPDAEEARKKAPKPASAPAGGRPPATGEPDKPVPDGPGPGGSAPDGTTREGTAPAGPAPEGREAASGTAGAPGGRPKAATRTKTKTKTKAKTKAKAKTRTAAGKTGSRKSGTAASSARTDARKPGPPAGSGKTTSTEPTTG